MKHRKKIIKLGRMSSHRNAMLSNMAGSIIVHKKIYTTLPKASAVAPLIDKLITWARRGDLHARRLAFSILKDKTLVKSLFTDIVQLSSGHNGGYTRIIRAGNRTGDGAPMAIIELVGRETQEPKEEKGKKKEKPRKEKQEAKQKTKGKERK